MPLEGLVRCPGYRAWFCVSRHDPTGCSQSTLSGAPPFSMMLTSSRVLATNATNHSLRPGDGVGHDNLDGDKEPHLLRLLPRRGRPEDAPGVRPRAGPQLRPPSGKEASTVRAEWSRCRSTRESRGLSRCIPASRTARVGPPLSSNFVLSALIGAERAPAFENSRRNPPSAAKLRQTLFSFCYL